MPKRNLTKKSIKLALHFLIFTSGIFVTVSASSFIAFGSPPTPPNFRSMNIGRALMDQIGMTIFGSNFHYDLLNVNYQNHLYATGQSYAASVDSNRAGTLAIGQNIGVLGENKKNASNKYGRTGVIGQVISPTQGQGRGILGYLEPTGPINSVPGDPDEIPTYNPISSGNVYGLYADLGDSYFGNVTVGNNITSPDDGKIEIEGHPNFLDTLNVDGTVTAEKFEINPNLYNNSQITYPSQASNFMTNTLNKMTFIVENDRTVPTSPGSGVTSVAAACPAGSVRVSCHGAVFNTNINHLDYNWYSSYRGTNVSGDNGCISYAQNKQGGRVRTEAVCMAAQLPQ